MRHLGASHVEQTFLRVEMHLVTVPAGAKGVRGRGRQSGRGFAAGGGMGCTPGPNQIAVLGGKTARSHHIYVSWVVCIPTSHTHTHTHIYTYTHIHSHTDTQTHTQTHRHTDTQTQRHTDTLTRRHTDI